VFSVPRRLAREARDAQVTFLAAAIAYYAFVSLVPLLLVALAVGTALGGERVADAVVAAVGDVLTPGGRELLTEALLGATGRGPATAAGLVVLLWSGLRVFRGLDIAVSRVYGVEAHDSVPEQLLDAVVVLGAIAAAVAASAVLLGAVPALGLSPPGALATLALPVVLAAAFLPVYYVFPDVEVGLRAVLPGTVFAAVGWTVLARTFQLYVGAAGQFELYGLLGAVLLLLTWFYLAGIIIIVGAVLNAVLAGRTGDGDGADAEDEESTADSDGRAPDIVALQSEVRQLRERLDERTVSRSDLEGDLRAYVRKRVRRGHARGWGPYLVLLYGTAMTVAAFAYLQGVWAIFAMFVVWLSTLGLYTLMVLLGATFNAARVPGRIVGWVRSRR
jgi:YihY family inner membrane protein